MSVDGLVRVAYDGVVNLREWWKMRYVQKEHHVEVHPETVEEVDRLREQYPHLWPFEYVCVHNDPETKMRHATGLYR